MKLHARANGASDGPWWPWIGVACLFPSSGCCGPVSSATSTSTSTHPSCCQSSGGSNYPAALHDLSRSAATSSNHAPPSRCHPCWGVLSHLHDGGLRAGAGGVPFKGRGSSGPLVIGSMLIPGHRDHHPDLQDVDAPPPGKRLHPAHRARVPRRGNVQHLPLPPVPDDHPTGPGRGGSDVDGAGKARILVRILLPLLDRCSSPSASSPSSSTGTTSWAPSSTSTATR